MGMLWDKSLGNPEVRAGMLSMGSNLLATNRPSRSPQTLSSNLGQSLGAYQQGAGNYRAEQMALRKAEEDKKMAEKRRRMMDAQIANLASGGGAGYGQYNPRDYTADSWAVFVKGGGKDPSVLKRFKPYSVVDAGGGMKVLVDSDGKPMMPVNSDTFLKNKGDSGIVGQASSEGKTMTPEGMEVVPGSETAKEESTQARISGRIAGFAARDIRLARELLKKSSDNAYSRTAQSKVLGTDEYELEQQIKSLQATVGIDNLLDIKKSGAGLGQVPQAQLDLLSRLMGQLSVGRDKKLLDDILADIDMTYTDVLNNMNQSDRAKIGIAAREGGGMGGSGIKFMGFE